VIALVAARAVARGVLAPVEQASRAAERIERGDLSARVPVASADEFGDWAETFNRMAASLEETIGRLEAAQSHNRRFVADVSHELRTPLAALVAEASILRGPGAPGAAGAGKRPVATSPGCEPPRRRPDGDLLTPAPERPRRSVDLVELVTTSTARLRGGEIARCRRIVVVRELAPPDEGSSATRQREGARGGAGRGRRRA
jgi:HAMP domain-containing protein